MTDATHAQFCVKKMLHSVCLFIIVIYLHDSCAVTLNEPNNTEVLSDYTNKETHDKYLILIDQIRKSSSLATARQNVVTQNTTTTSAPPNSQRCVCDKGVCKCCTGYFLDLLKQKACMRVTYHPGEFAFDVAMSLNDRILYENSISGKNPKPICVSPPRINNLKVCAKFYNIMFPGRNFHFCLAMSGQWRSFELFNFAFDCLRMGANGIAMVKPYENGGLPIPNPQGGVDAVIDAGDEDIEDYDENVIRSLLDELFD